MAIARSQLIDTTVARWYHCISYAACVHPRPSCWAKGRMTVKAGSRTGTDLRNRRRRLLGDG